MRILLRTAAAAILICAACTGSASAGKGKNNRTPTPSAAEKTMPSVSPHIDVINQSTADIKGSTKFLHCQTRGCLHGH